MLSKVWRILFNTSKVYSFYLQRWQPVVWRLSDFFYYIFLALHHYIGMRIAHGTIQIINGIMQGILTWIKIYSLYCTIFRSPLLVKTSHCTIFSSMEPLVNNYRPCIVLFCITLHFSGTVDGTMQGIPVAGGNKNFSYSKCS